MTTHYLNLQFAERVGWDFHEFLAWYAPRLLGEWLFARAAFRARAPESSEYLGVYGDKLGPLRGFGEYLVQLREREVPAFIEDCLSEIPWGDYDVVGFGSVFEQNCAGLALARRIKERFPSVATVFGGANFDGDMGLEYVRACPWIDYAVIGEADDVFPELLDQLASGVKTVAPLAGVARREPDGVRYEGRAPIVHDLNRLPTPDYGDFFSAEARSRRPRPKPGFTVQVPFESARGCWWGAKSHCTFCGLNGTTMAYRSKSPARVLDEIDELAQRYSVRMFGAVDNILDHRYVADVFGRLAERRAGYAFFYEVKVNLTRDQLRTLAKGGLRRVQPGIETLSTHVLRLMRKGATALQNVRFLKWAHYYGMEITWNLLLGTPGERLEDYERQLTAIPLLRHLPPAVAVTEIHLDRFSPYFDFHDTFGMRNVRPDPAYATVYPSEVDLERIAYYFAHEAVGTVPLDVHSAIRAAVCEWFVAWQAPARPDLRYEWSGECLAIRDTRWGEPPRMYRFTNAAAHVYELCSTTDRTAAGLLPDLKDQGFDIGEAELTECLRTFTAAGLMLEDDGHFLSLALPQIDD